MRLTQAEIAGIVACARDHFGAGCKVRLFGSRVDDRRRGGDIDLHIEAAEARLATLRNELEFRVDLTDRIGEQRVDVILRPPGFDPRPIDLIAVESGVALT